MTTGRLAYTVLGTMGLKIQIVHKSLLKGLLLYIEE